MDPQILGGAREIPPMALEHASDEPLLELAARVREEDAPVDHLGDECVQLLLHGMTLPQPAAVAAEGGRPMVPGGRRVCARARTAAVMVLTAPLRARGSTRRAP